MSNESLCRTNHFAGGNLELGLNLMIVWAAQFVPSSWLVKATRIFGLVVAVSLSGCGSSGGDSAGPSLAAQAKMTPAATLGEQIFKDVNLSEPSGQACASCHDASKAHASNITVEPGAVIGRFGFRNAPSLRYLKFAPDFGYGDDGPVGGFFRDGRARNLIDQAQRPFVNHNEMNNADVVAVIAKLSAASYAGEFARVWGEKIFADPVNAFNKIALSLAAYQREDVDFAPFSSKFDLWLAGKEKLSERELQGWALFNDPEKGNCAACHPSKGPDPKTPPLFTDHTYDNLGLPRNPAIAANTDADYFDLGLCGPTRLDITNAALCGAFKVPSLRNVALTAPYFHNGIFNSLRDAVKFYVTRDTQPELWYPADGNGGVFKFNDLPEKYQGNVNITEVPYNRLPGQEPALNDDEIDLVVEFLTTLTDGFR